MRILKRALLAALLMALAVPALAELDVIDHYVVKADVRAYMMRSCSSSSTARFSPA